MHTVDYRIFLYCEFKLCSVQVPGWRVASAGTDKAVTCIQQSWRLKDEAAAEEAAARFGGVAAAEGHAESLRVARVGSELVAELWTASLGERGIEYS